MSRWTKSLTNIFSNRLNTVNVNIFPTHGGIHTKVMSCPVSLMLTLIRGIDILFGKLTPQIEGRI